ncbi:MAG: hypothetical protein O2904_00890 [bacterium]|nr:hypothetical protein [bacterium]
MERTSPQPKGERILTSPSTEEIIRNGRRSGLSRTAKEFIAGGLAILILIGQYFVIQAKPEEEEPTAQPVALIAKTSPRLTSVMHITIEDKTKSLINVTFSGPPCVGELFFSQQLCGEWLKLMGKRATVSNVRFNEKEDSLTLTFNTEELDMDEKFRSRITSFKIEDGLYTATCTGDMDEYQIECANRICGQHHMVEKPARMYSTACVPSYPVVEGNNVSFKISPLQLSSR